MPGVLIIEAMAQAAGILVAASVRSRTRRHACIGGQRQAPSAGGAWRSAPSRGDQAERSSRLRLASPASPRSATRWPPKPRSGFVMVDAHRAA